ncbi:MAG: hypothetical protein AAFW81_11315 [Pseudomonadota bacterium]
MNNAQTASNAMQLTLPLPALRPRYDRASFLIAPSNENAWRAANAWLSSEEPALVICGPQGAGKTHLATIIAGDGGAFIDWRAPPPTATAPDVVVFDDLPAPEPRAFMTTIEEFAAAGKKTILVGRGHPSEWAMGLKDLRTRLEAIPRATLHEPDEGLLRAVMSKAFADRQIMVAPNVIEYAAPRLPRLFTAAQSFAALADSEAARRKKKVSVALAREIIEALVQSRALALPSEAPEETAL